jgi:hypothetical protein
VVGIGEGSVTVAVVAGGGASVGEAEAVPGAAVLGGAAVLALLLSAARASSAEPPSSLGPRAQARSATAPTAEKTIAEAEPLKERISHSPVRYDEKPGLLAAGSGRHLAGAASPPANLYDARKPMLAFLRVVRWCVRRGDERR